MTYEPFKLGDRAILDIMMSARKLGVTTMIHAENSDMISLITERLEQRGLTDPYYHGIARPQIAEAEATYRAISLAELLDVPILIVHVSSRIAMAHIRDAQTRMLPIHGETCPHYAYLLSEGMAQPNFEGAKHVCSPPLRHDMSDLEAIWDGIANGTFTTLSSDHAPVKFDSPLGKKAGLINGKTPMFTKIPNGLPGIETRIPLMFNGAVGDNPKISLPRFVQITSTGPAMLYGLAGVKGNIAPGYDADLVIWYPTNHTFLETHLSNGNTNGINHHHNDGVRISADNLHHDTDYTPYEGLHVANWPRYTILRGEVVWARDEGGIAGYKGQGKFLKRKAGKVLQGRYPATRPPQYMRPGERELWA
jgi:dihydropyrimidinase